MAKKIEAKPQEISGEVKAVAEIRKALNEQVSILAEMTGVGLQRAAIKLKASISSLNSYLAQNGYTEEEAK